MARPQLVGTAAAEATSVSLPSTAKVGDLLIVHAFRDGSAVNPGTPTGWTTINNTWDGTSCSSTTGWRQMAPGDTGSGTWTNATGVIVIVIRGAAEGTAGWLLANTTQGTAASITYTASSPVSTLGMRHNLLIVATAWHRSVDVDMTIAVSNMRTVSTSGVGTTNEYGIYVADTVDDGWESTTQAVGGTASGWMTCVWQFRGVALRGEGLVNNHGPSASAGSHLNTTAVGRVENTGIISVTERRVSMGGF